MTFILEQLRGILVNACPLFLNIACMIWALTATHTSVVSFDNCCTHRTRRTDIIVKVVQSRFANLGTKSESVSVPEKHLPTRVALWTTGLQRHKDDLMIEL